MQTKLKGDKRLTLNVMGHLRAWDEWNDTWGLLVDLCCSRRKAGGSVANPKPTSVEVYSISKLTYRKKIHIRVFLLSTCRSQYTFLYVPTDSNTSCHHLHRSEPKLFLLYTDFETSLNTAGLPRPLKRRQVLWREKQNERSPVEAKSERQ